MILFFAATASLFASALADPAATTQASSTLLSIPSFSRDCNAAKPSIRAQAITLASTKIHNEPRTKPLKNLNGAVETLPFSTGPVYRKTPGQELYLEELSKSSATLTKFENVHSDQIANVTRDNLARLKKSKGSLSYADYAETYALLETKGLIAKPLALNNSDEVFGAVRLGLRGQNLKLVQHSDQVYKNDLAKAATSPLVKRVCGKDSLDVALAHNTIFVSDFTNTNKYNDDKSTLDKYTVDTRGYFCFNAALQLFLPLAITIVDTGLVYTRDDSPGEWQLAKMALDAVEYNFQQVRHLLEVHMELISVEVELMRSVATEHPIYKLLKHHFFGNFAFELRGSQLLLELNTRYDETFSFGARGSIRLLLDEFHHVDLSETAPEEFTRRGLAHVPINRLTKYGVKYFDILAEFVHKFVDVYYKSDSDVSADCELQHWAENMQKIPEIRGFPAKFDSRKKLERLITQFIFQHAVKHHFMNGHVTWHGAAAPFTTASLWNKAKGLPKKKGVAVNPLDYAMPQEIVPDFSNTASRFLRPLPREMTLLEVYKNTALEAQPQLAAAITKLRADMKAMEAFVLAEEKKMAVPLDFFRPSHSRTSRTFDWGLAAGWCTPSRFLHISQTSVAHAY